MKNLNKYIDQKNAWNRIIGDEEIDPKNLTQEIAQKLFSQLSGDLSPENLHCDGEITAAAAQKKAIHLYATGHELLAMGFIDNNTHSEFN